MSDTKKENLERQILMEKLMNKAEENRLLRERIKTLEAENIDLKEKLHQLKGNFDLVVLETDIQQTVLMEYAKDKTIGGIYASLRSRGFTITIDTIKNIVYQFDVLPAELKEFYEKEREYYLKSNKTSYLQQINQSVNSLIQARDSISILLADVMDEVQTKAISVEVAEDRIMKLTDRLLKLESTIIKSRQEDTNYSSIVKNEIKDQSDQDLEEYDKKLNKLINIDDLLKESNTSLIYLETEEVE